MSWFRASRATRAGAGRDRGEPPSANGASSMHLFWTLPGQFAAAEVTLEVLEDPAVNRLYFWALQASFTDGHRELGAGHLGLQFHPDYPGGRAVNWGGYHHRGGELAGTTSTLPGSLGNVNTRDYPWSPRVAYRLRIDASPHNPGAWRGSLVEPGRPEPVVVRELLAGGTHLQSLMMWSEVFARCEDPSVLVRWSNPVAYDDTGAAHRPSELSVNYQSHRDGGCANTTARLDDLGVCQRTACPRIVAQGTRLRLG